MPALSVVDQKLTLSKNLLCRILENNYPSLPRHTDNNYTHFVQELITTLENYFEKQPQFMVKAVRKIKIELLELIDLHGKMMLYSRLPLLHHITRNSLIKNQQMYERGEQLLNVITSLDLYKKQKALRQK